MSHRCLAEFFFLKKLLLGPGDGGWGDTSIVEYLYN
jgi:hypothetical protein